MAWLSGMTSRGAVGGAGFHSRWALASVRWVGERLVGWRWRGLRAPVTLRPSAGERRPNRGRDGRNPDSVAPVTRTPQGL